MNVLLKTWMGYCALVSTTTSLFSQNSYTPTKDYTYSIENNTIEDKPWIPRPSNDPPWWFECGVTDDLLNTTKEVDNKLAVTQGQLKNFATAAYVHMELHLHGGAGAALRTLVQSWKDPVTGLPKKDGLGSNTRHFEPATQGQLKSLTGLFLNRLAEVGYMKKDSAITNATVALFPWKQRQAQGHQANPNAVANIGMVKSLFSWDLQKDKDTDGLPDWWEVKYWGQSDLATYAETSVNREKVSVKTEATLNTVLARASQDDLKEGKPTYEHYFDGTSPVAGAAALGHMLGAPNITTVTTEYDAHRLLMQATFGPMPKDADNLKALKGTAKEWILRQIALGANNINLTNVHPDNVVSTIESALNNTNLSWKNQPDTRSLETSWLIDDRYFPHSSRPVPRTEDTALRANWRSVVGINTNLKGMVPAGDTLDTECRLDVENLPLTVTYKPSTSPVDPLRTTPHVGDYNVHYLNAYGNAGFFRQSSTGSWHNIDASYLNNGLGSISLNHEFFKRAFHNQDQLRQRIAFALSQILVISKNETALGGNNAMSGVANYYNALLENSFGNYKNLLHRVTLHPVMGHFLTLRSSAATPKPIENYARELLQLFTLGTESLRLDGSVVLDSGGVPVPSYVRNDVVDLARALTGWSFNRYSRYSGRYWEHGPIWTGITGYMEDCLQDKAFWRDQMEFGPGLADQNLQPTGGMMAFTQYHDSGNKVLFENKTYHKSITGGATGPLMNQEVLDSLDGIVNHPSHAPFLAKQLISFLVTNNPSRGYVYRVAKVFKNSKNSNKQLSDCVQAILTDVEARNADVAGMRTYGKLREPLIRLVNFMKLCQTREDPINRYLYHSMIVYDQGDANSQIPAKGIINGVLVRSQKENTDYVFKNIENDGEFYRRHFIPIGLSTHLNQSLLSAPSVFNFYSPQFSTDYLSYYKLKSPTSQIQTPTLLYSSLFYVTNGLYNNYGDWTATTISISRGATPEAEHATKMTNLDAYPDTTSLIETYISKAAFGGRMPQSYKQALTSTQSNQEGIFNLADANSNHHPYELIAPWVMFPMSWPGYSELTSNQLPTNHSANLTYGYTRKYNQLRSASLLYLHPTFAVQK
jgi:uncharacterized protein (DUF1800 family)